MKNNKKIREYIVKIMGLAYDINMQGKYHMFVNFSGHVNDIVVSHYGGLWKSGKSLEYRKQFNFDGMDHFDEKTAQSIIKHLKQLLIEGERNLDKSLI